MSIDPRLLERFQAAAADADAEFAMGLVVSEVIDPHVDSTRVLAVFDELTASIQTERVESVTQLTHSLISHGFGRPLSQPVDFDHSNMEWVLHHRVGIPITLALVAIATARRCGLQAVGLNYPGHFLAMVDGHTIDPVRLQLVNSSDLSAQHEDGFDLSRVPRARSRAIGLRMLNNLKALHLARSNLPAALDILDYQLAVADDDEATRAALHFERGEYWRQLGAVAAALEAYEVCFETVPASDRELAEAAQQRIADLKQRPETLH